jgi:hypothetical protein
VCGSGTRPPHAGRNTGTDNSTPTLQVARVG